MKQNATASIALTSLLLILDITCMENAQKKTDEITISDGTTTFTRTIASDKIGKPIVQTQTFYVFNNTPYPIEARVEGFGTKNVNSQLSPYNLLTGGVNIQPNGKFPFSRIMTETQFPINFTRYTLYAHALIVNLSSLFNDHQNSEVHFTSPFDATIKQFIVTTYRDTENPKQKLLIENK